MKRIVGLLSAALILCSSAFTKNFFAERFFEVQTTVEAGVSNNVISMNELMKKNLVIDLKKLAAQMPKDGLTTSAYANTCISFNLNIPLVKAGLDSGVEVYERASLSKDIFDALGNGTTIGETINAEVMNYTDVFSYTDVHVGLNFGRFKIEAKPAIFTPLFSSAGSAVSVSFLNDDDGRVYASYDADLKYYSPINITDFSSISVSSFTSGMGFDIAGTVQIPLNDKTAVSVSGRIPFVPGRISKVSYLTMGSSFEAKSFDINNAEKNSVEKKNVTEDTVYYINRPLKMDGYIHYKPMGFLFELTAGLGFGVYHPFMTTARFYPEYYFSAGLNFIDFVGVSLSTEYTNQVFKHQIGTVLNVRIIEIDTGISLQSSNFAKSFSSSGFGAYVVFSMGF